VSDGWEGYVKNGNLEAEGQEDRFEEVREGSDEDSASEAYEDAEANLQLISLLKKPRMSWRRWSSSSKRSSSSCWSEASL
jgi:hypothetical protein